MIKFHCLNCKKKIGVEDAHADRRVKCPGCGRVLTVPGPGSDQTEQRPSRGGDRPNRTLSDLAALDLSAGTPVGKGADEDIAAQPGRPLIVLVGFGLLVAVALIAIIFGNLVTKLFFVFIVSTTLQGYWLGASKVAATLAGLILATLLAVPLGRLFEGLFGALLGTTGLTNRMISTAAMAVILTVAVAAAVQFFVGRKIRQMPDWKRYDRLIGSGMGLAEGTLLGFVVIWAILAMEPMALTSLAQSEIDPDAQVNPNAEMIANLARTARNSAVGAVADAVNPLADMRLFTLFHSGLIVFNDPVAREHFVNHESIQNLQKHGSVNKCMDALYADAKIKAILEAGDGITGDELKTILDSEALLVILDETTIVSDLSPLADDIEKAINESREKAAPLKLDPSGREEQGTGSE